MSGHLRLAEFKYAGPTALFFFVYLLGAEVGQALSFPNHFATCWPPSGIYFAALVLTQVRMWPLIALTALAAATSSNMLLHGMSLPVNVGYWLGNSLDAVLAAGVIRLVCGRDFSLSRLRDVLLLCASTLISGAIGGVVGAGTSAYFHGSPFGQSWRIWWLAVCVGVLVVGPVILSMTEPRSRRTGRWFVSLEEAAGWLLLAIGARWLPHHSGVPQVYLLFPVMLWITVRFEIQGAAWASLLVALITIWETLHHLPQEISPIAVPAIALQTQSFVTVSSMSFLTLACALAERRRAAEQSRENEESYRDLFENMNDLVQSAAPDGRLLYANRAWRDTLGYSSDELQTLSLMDIVHPDQRAHCRELFEQVRNESRLDFFETTLLTKAGAEIHVEGNVTYQFKGAELVATRVIFRDVTSRKLAERKAIEYQKQLESMNTKLRALSVTDALTQLYNRRFFQQTLNEEHERAVRYDMPLSLLLLDVDFFKKFNDTYGHLAGDAVLCKVSQILRENARGSDVVARFGGEEFAILLPVTDHKGALLLAERYRQAIEAGPWTCRAVTVSVGVATTIGGKLDVSELTRLADDALYLSKQNGRNRVSSGNQKQSGENILSSDLFV